MSLRDDLAAMYRHKASGTLREHLQGTATPIPYDEPVPELEREEERAREIVQRFNAERAK